MAPHPLANSPATKSKVLIGTIGVLGFAAVTYYLGTRDKWSDLGLFTPNKNRYVLTKFPLLPLFQRGDLTYFNDIYILVAECNTRMTNDYLCCQTGRYSSFR